MSGSLKAIAARYAAGLRAAGELAPAPEGRRLEVLRAMARYGVGVNHLSSVLDQQGRGFVSVTLEEWEEYVLSKINHDLGPCGGERNLIGYLTHGMAWLFPDLPRITSGVWARKAIDERALPEIIRQFRRLPDAEAFLE